MKRFSLPFFAALLFVINVLSIAGAQVPKYDVLTHHNDIYRSGVYSSETILRPTNVNSKSFGKIFARRVLGQIWGQPLYVRGVPVNGRLRNVVYVATSENWVYGFDADDRTPYEGTKPLMCVFLGSPQWVGDRTFQTIYPSNGITSTPAIDIGIPPDPSKGMLYVVARLKQDDKFHIFALDLRSLAIRPNATGQKTGVIVSVTVPGQGTTTVSFDEDEDHLNRPALLISNNYLIIAFGSGPNNDQDAPNYHGWVMSYSLPNLVRTGVFVTTPTKGMGGIWQSGNGPAADDQGNVYFLTGNGDFQSTRVPLDLANAFVKLANSDGTLRLRDWYAPPSRDILKHCDLDLGSSGPALLQDAGKVLGVGKSGILYVLDKENLGKTDTALAAPAAWRGTPDCTTGQCFRVAENQYASPANTKLACPTSDIDTHTHFSGGDKWKEVVESYPHVHGAPVVWNLGNGTFNLYVWPEQDYLKVYRFDGKSFSPNPVGSSAPVAAARMSMPGGVLSLSWNGANATTGIIWAARPDPDARQNAVDTPFVSVFRDQQHFVFRNMDGAVWDSFYARAENKWHFQQVNFSGIPATGGVFVSVFDAADQQHFAYTDGVGNIWHSLYRRGDRKWLFHQIDTHGHPAVGGIFVSAFHDQQHFVWRDASGSIWDSFYAQADDKWHFNHINTNGHPATGGVFVSVFDAADQQHFVYTDGVGNIWDSLYRRGDHKWLFHQIDTHGHPPAGGIFVSAFYDQQHFVWRDASGSIWDSFYAQADDKWHFNTINSTFNCMDSSASNLTPDDAPCNAINKIVRGYVEAFAATPTSDGHLVKLWNSKDNQNDGVWFAKQGPPTIADGKVFLAEFPPPLPRQEWSDNNAFGRLVVYSLR
jgi:hypothetical protein